MSSYRFVVFLMVAMLPAWLLAQLTIEMVAYPMYTPTDDSIYVAGDFQAWDPASSSSRMSYDASGELYRLHLPGQSGAISFKFTRGSWDRVESDGQGGFFPNRNHTTAPGDTLRLEVLGWEDLDGSQPGSTAAENVQVLDENFPMLALNRSRRIWLYLPPDYAGSTKDYPVFYMHDGQNIFDATTSFAGEWEVDETLNELFEQGDSGIIVVGIDHGGSLRIEEYTPWSNPQYGGGGGEEYVSFIVDELKPYIDAHYRTRPEREWTAIGGSSLGGLISLYAALSEPETFGKVAALSPAYWINRDELIPYIQNLDDFEPFRFYQLIGTPEGESYVDDMYTIETELLQAGLPATDIRSVEHADGAHSEWYWAREFGAVYDWLFADSPTSVDEYQKPAHDLAVWPNPTSGPIHLSWELGEGADGRSFGRLSQVQISLVDSLGRVVSRHQLGQQSAGRCEYRLWPTGLAPGQYRLQLQLGADLVQRTILLQ